MIEPRIVELQKQAAARDDVIGLSGGLPAEELLPRTELASALAEVTTSREEALQYGWPEGADELRQWIAKRLTARGANVDADRVIITAGAQQALAIAASAFAGRDIAVGDATYRGAMEAFRSAGARVVAAGGDARYVIAGVSNPHGVAHDEYIDDDVAIVDEAYAELRFDGKLPPLLLASAPKRVWHVGTISKTVAPGLRVGWLVPPAAEHDAALERKEAADLATSSLSQAAFARLLRTLDYDALVARARAEYASRAAALVAAMRRHAPALPFKDPEGGFSIWVETDATGDETALLEAALAERVMVDPGNLFRVEPREHIAFRVSFSHVRAEQMAEGAQRLARMWQRFTGR